VETIDEVLGIDQAWKYYRQLGNDKAQQFLHYQTWEWFYIKSYQLLITTVGRTDIGHDTNTQSYAAFVHDH